MRENELQDKCNPNNELRQEEKIERKGEIWHLYCTRLSAILELSLVIATEKKREEWLDRGIKRVLRKSSFRVIYRRCRDRFRAIPGYVG